MAFRQGKPATCGVVLFLVLNSLTGSRHAIRGECAGTGGGVGRQFLRCGGGEVACGALARGSDPEERKTEEAEEMTNVLVYSRDDTPGRACPQSAPHGLKWHSSHRVLSGLLPADCLWVVTSGKALGRPDSSAVDLVGVWPVASVIGVPAAVPGTYFGSDGLFRQTRILSRTRIFPGLSAWPILLCVADSAAADSDSLKNSYIR